MNPDEAVTVGLRWLRSQPGEPVILFAAKKMVSNNRMIESAARQYQIPVEAPNTVWKSGFAGDWEGGAVLAPWASSKVVDCIDEDLTRLARAVCIIGWVAGEHDNWIAARGAVDPRGGGAPVRSKNDLINDPVVRIAIDDAEGFVNHNNALVGTADKAYFVRTLQELVRGGHRFDLDEVTAYAMATGWTPAEIKRIREYGQRVLDGRRFNLRIIVGPQAGACARWEAEAAAENA